MSADGPYLKNAKEILKNGFWDTKEIVRPKWADGTPAHTAKIFAVNNVYDLKQGFPIITSRKTNWKAATDEVLWIWQKKSNNVHDLNSHIWDQWADENGSIGKAYGYQVGRKAIYKDGEYDQIDRVIWYLKNQPAFRSMVTELFVHEDLHEMGLYPCVHGMQLDVTDGELNMFLNQRSNDLLAAGNWNVVQYSVLLHMLAQVCNLKVGKLSHMVVNSHIYDRHVPFIVDIMLSRAKMLEVRLVENLDKIRNSNEISQSWKDKAEEFAELVFGKSVNYDLLINEARHFEKNPTDYEAYTHRIVETPAFKKADKMIDWMVENPEFEKLLGFSTPRLVLDKNVTDFYDFQSPKMRDANGKIVDNPNSSFKVENYNYETEGIKFQEKVPVAE